MHVRLKHVALGATALVPWVTTPARAAITISITNANVGKIAMPSASGSTLTISPAAATTVTQTGSGVFVPSAPATRARVIISCTGGGGGGCSANTRIILSNVSVDAPVTSNGSFTVAMGTASATTTLPAANAPYTFTIGAIGNNSSKDFYVGNRMVLSSASVGTGPGFAMWQVAVSNASANATNSTAQSLVTALKPMAVSKVSDLQFGTITRPTATSGTVTMSPAGVLTLPGEAATLGSHTAAAFAVSGEPSTVFSLSMASSFLMTGTGGTLTASLIPSQTYTTSGSMALNGSGSYSLGVGASFALGTGTNLGSYAGSFSVTAVYN